MRLPPPSAQRGKEVGKLLNIKIGNVGTHTGVCEYNLRIAKKKKKTEKKGLL